MANLNIDELEQSVIQAVWSQWASLGSFIDSNQVAQSIIDPEALLFISLCLREREKRLWDVLASWAKHGSNLFSIQRVKNLRMRFPEAIGDGLAQFATLAKEEGKDFRWRSLAGADRGPTVRTYDLWKAYPHAWHSAALVVRMRLGFGVGIVADILPFLISLRGGGASARAMAEATGYSVHAVRRTADNMAAGQLIERTRGKPAQYRVEIEKWSGLLGAQQAQEKWRYWHKVYSLVATLIVRKEQGDWEGQSQYMLSSYLRDLMEDHAGAFILNQIEFPDPRQHPGEQYSSAFAGAVADLAEWIRRVV